MRWSERRVAHGGVDLLVRQIGEAKQCDVVMLPSLGRGSHDFDALAAQVAEAGYRVMLPEPRGIGDSKGPLDGQSLHDFANDVAAVIAHVCAPPVMLI